MFEPQNYLIDVKGNDYLPVNRRIQWFRDVYPLGTITTEIVMDQPLTFRATVLVEGKVIAIAHASKRQGSYLVESTETAAIGRALAIAGYGTQFTHPDEEDDPAPVDAPVEQPSQGDKIDQKVWDRWDALLQDARNRGIDVDDVDRGTITLAELTDLAKNLKVMISKDKLGA